MPRLSTSLLALLFAALATSNCVSAVVTTVWHRFMLPTTAPGKCLDGTPGGFWISPGVEHTKYLIHLEGGGWCISYEDCLARSQTNLGSSLKWPVNVTTNQDGGDHGLLNREMALNPVTHNWTLVYVGYCDGGSFAGFRDGAMLVNGTKIFFRGRAILNGIIEMLLKGHGMDAATDVVLAGTSAGGLAVILTADHVGSVLPSTIKFRALPGAGLFMSGVKNINGVLAYQKNYAWVFKAQNASGGVNQNCIPSTPSGYEFRCFLAPYALPYVSTPMYLINALQDRWQAINILGTTCNPTVAGNCTAAELTALSGLGSAMIDAVTQPILDNPANGAFLPNCWTHCLEDTDMGLHKLTVGGKTMAEGILQFLATGNGTLASAVDGTTLNPSCPAAFCGAA